MSDMSGENPKAEIRRPRPEADLALTFATGSS
jgi:hypothetical protein